MRLKDKALLSALIWAFVYPGVLLISYGFQWLGIELAMWLEIMVSTALTVPLISLVAAPQVEKIVAATRGQSAAEMKIDQAREAPGPESRGDREAVTGRRHLAQLNVGRLVAPTDDPRVAEFMAALDRVNGLGKRMPGFVWMMEGSGEPGTGNTEAKIGGDPRFVANLTVWETAEALETFVWKTVHRQFYERRAEWFEVLGAMHFALWWAPAGHRPSLDEALARLEHLKAHGDTDHAFGWAHLREARLWRDARCAAVAAE